MKVLLIAVALSLLFAHQRARADEGTKQKSDDGMAIAEQLLLQDDVTQPSQPLPAKEEKVEQKKRATDEDLPEAPLLGDDVKSEDVPAEASAAPAEVLQTIANDDQAAPKAGAGSLDYEMQTVDMLADAPADAAPGEKAPADAESLAKR